MTRNRISIAIVVLGLCGAAGVMAQQRFGGGGGRRWRDPTYDSATGFGDAINNGVPAWQNDPNFKSDVFTFVRIRYGSPSHGSRRGRPWAWQTDFPDSDSNFSFRLQQMTSLKTDPHGLIIDLTDPRLFDYPFIYMLEVGSLEFTDEEIACLRKYLLNGGFLMVDDHWGVAEYENFHEQMLRVFPDREPQELSLDHPIFHCVFDLKAKPQIPGIDVARRVRGTNITWEREDAKEPHYRAIYDDKGRIIVLICSNTDLGDGWEREGEEEWYFHQFSEKQAYPMGINIIYWAMTH